MRKSRFTEEQIIGILQEQEAGMKTTAVCRKHGVSAPTFYAWKAKYGGMSVPESKRLKQQEEDNPRLKPLLAGAMLDNTVLKDITSRKVVTPVARRTAVAVVREARGISQRRACSVLGADRSSVRYRRRRADDAAERARLKALAAERRRAMCDPLSRR
jgi:putative transposase